jgi:hypothetical protein
MHRFRMAHRPPRRLHLDVLSARMLLIWTVLVLGTLVAPACALAKRQAPWWSRTFESPEMLPAAYPFCCGTFWDTLLLSATSSGAVVPGPMDPGNHVFAAHVGPNNGQDFADWSLLTQDAETSRGRDGTSVWVRLRLYFPPSFKPTGYTAGQINSEWNWLTTFHESGAWAKHCAGEDPSSVAIGILNSRPRHGAPNPRFRLHLAGGVQSTSKCVPNLLRIDGPQIRLGHWYTLLEHVVFSPSGSGLVQVWIDGRRMANVHFPTMYRHPDGSVGNYYFCFGYYRLRSSWNATVLFDNVAEGPTRASVKARRAPR